MFKIFKRVENLESRTIYTVATSDFVIDEVLPKIKALEEYLGIEFFHGDKSKPHYRKKRVAAKKLGRPRKIK